MSIERGHRVVLLREGPAMIHEMVNDPLLPPTTLVPTRQLLQVHCMQNNVGGLYDE